MRAMREAWARKVGIGLLPLLLTACASVPAYHPMDLHHAADVLAARQLDDPGLAAAETRFGLPADTTAAWTPDRITVAAWYFSPALAQTRAAAAHSAADAAVAAQRTNPTLSLSPEKAISGAIGSSPWTIGISLLLPLLHPGEAAARRDVAVATTEAALDQVALAVWQSRTQALAALRGVLLARQAQALAQTVAREQSAYLASVRVRVMVGDVDRNVELDAELQAQRAEADLSNRRAQRSTAEQALAAALGLPWSTLAHATLDWPGLDVPPAPARLPSSVLAEDAAWNRLDLAALLAQYRAAVARLHMAAGTRFSTLAMAPGYLYDQGQRKFTFGLDAELPLFHGAGARIRAAAAACDEAATAVRARQATILNALDAARADYAERYAAWQRMQSAAGAAQQAAQRARAQQRAGQTDHGTELIARVAAATAALAANDALSSALHSLGRLQDVLQRPIWPATRLAAVPAVSPPTHETTHAHRF